MSDNNEITKYTKKSIMNASINSLTVMNDSESYKEYFKLGGTVSKMSLTTTKNYHYFLKNKNAN